MRARSRIALVLLAMMLAVPAWAQDEATQKVKQTSEAYQTAYNKLLADYRREQDAEKKQQIVSERLPEIYKEYAEKFQEIATQHPGTDGAAEALAMVCQFGPRHPDGSQLAVDAKETLLKDFLNHKGLVPAIGMWGADDAILEKLVTESTSREVQGVALFFQMSKAKGRELSEENVETVKPMMERITKDFGDVHLLYPGGMDRGTLGDLVENELFAFENLRIGKVAPEVEGEDIAGVNFKLSDYRGKVVVIDFWGDW